MLQPLKSNKASYVVGELVATGNSGSIFSCHLEGNVGQDKTLAVKIFKNQQFLDFVERVNSLESLQQIRGHVELVDYGVDSSTGTPTQFVVMEMLG